MLERGEIWQTPMIRNDRRRFAGVGVDEFSEPVGDLVEEGPGLVGAGDDPARVAAPEVQRDPPHAQGVGRRGRT